MAHEPNAQQTTSWTLGREHGGDLRHAVERAHAVSGPARPEACDDGRGVRSLERHRRRIPDHGG